MSGWEVVRARDHVNGDHYTTTRHRATLRGDTILEGRDPLDKNGNWRTRTPHITITPVRARHGRFTSEPTKGEEEA